MAPARTVRATSRSTLRGTDPARASVWKDRMDSARRCSMFLRRAYRSMRCFDGGCPVVGDDDGRGVAAQAGDDELPDRSGVVAGNLACLRADQEPCEGTSHPTLDMPGKPELR